MTYVIVNDASCLIDLRKGRLLHVLLQLPHRFVVPLPIRHSELLEFTDQEWQLLDDGGLVTFDLPPELVGDAFTAKGTHPKLSANDCFCLVTTRYHENGILLTGDRLLRRVATGEGLRVHGALWVIDELHAHGVGSAELLVSALEIWRDDPTVRLGALTEIEERLRNLRRK